MNRNHVRLLVSIVILSFISTIMAESLYINELFFDPPVGDSYENPSEGIVYGNEYIEFRGTPGMSLNGYYLIMTESENTTNESNPTGNIDHVFNLSGMKIGTNGYSLVLPYGFERSRSLSNIAPGTSVYQNQIQARGFGSGSRSSIGANDQNGDGVIENGAFSALLVKVNSGIPPYVNLVLDSDKNSVVDTDLGLDWTIVDSIGQAEPGEEDGYSYSSVVFTSQSMDISHLAPGSTNVATGLEPEYLFRYGSSSGQKAEDWLMANVTNNTASGWTSENQLEYGYRLSGPHTTPLANGEIVRGISDETPIQTGTRLVVSEGTIIQNSLGRANFPIPDGDLNQDGLVGLDDLSILLDHWGAIDATLRGYWLMGDPSGDGLVGLDDLSFVLDNWGKREGGWISTANGMVWVELTSSGSSNEMLMPTILSLSADRIVLQLSDGQILAAGVPEPTTISLLALAGVILLSRRCSIHIH